MKPNDKAIEAAATSLFGNYMGGEKKWIEDALTAAYAAQFQSKDYAGLVDGLREWAGQYEGITLAGEKIIGQAADALEAVLAERDALNSEIKTICERESTVVDVGFELKTQNDRLRAERDALLARLAPVDVDDENLVEIGAKAMAKPPFHPWEKMSDTDQKKTKMALRAAIAAIRPHIKEAERERWQRMLARMGAGTTKTGAVNE